MNYNVGDTLTGWEVPNLPSGSVVERTEKLIVQDTPLFRSQLLDWDSYKVVSIPKPDPVEDLAKTLWEVRTEAVLADDRYPWPVDDWDYNSELHKDVYRELARFVIGRETVTLPLPDEFKAFGITMHKHPNGRYSCLPFDLDPSYEAFLDYNDYVEKGTATDEVWY